MTPRPQTCRLVPLLLGTFLLLPLCVGAQAATGRIELVVRATPSGGRPEKVMGQPFHLLRASLKAIEAQARAEVGEPNREAFIDGLDLSPELKVWMKRTGRLDLRGADFIAALTMDDVMGIPEFFLAYQERNLPNVGVGFPKRKAKLKDKKRNPKKWEESEKRYLEDVRTYLELHPESKQGLDEHLVHIDAALRWRTLLHQNAQRIRHHTVRLVETRYQLARTETDLEGRARFDNLVPGQYWISNLWNVVRAGDSHLNWDLPVELNPGQTLYLELTNANALLPGPNP